MPRPVLFVDFDGTLCEQRYWRSLPNGQYEHIQRDLFGGDRTLVDAWMLGEYTAEEINRRVAETYGIPYEELWSIFVKDCETMTISPAVLEKLRVLRNSYTTILMTVNMDSFSRFTVPALELDRHFDHISNSWEEKLHKSDDDGALFLRYADRLKTDMQSCVLIDDSPSNCEQFEKLGGKAYLVTPETGVEEYLERLSDHLFV